VLLAQGQRVGEICRRIGVSEQSYYRWRREYGGLKIDQARRLKDLEQENSRLKCAVTEVWSSDELPHLGRQALVGTRRRQRGLPASGGCLLALSHLHGRPSRRRDGRDCHHRDPHRAAVGRALAMAHGALPLPFG